MVTAPRVRVRICGVGTGQQGRDSRDGDKDVTSALCSSRTACFFSSTSSFSRITDALAVDVGPRRPSSGTSPWEGHAHQAGPGHLVRPCRPSPGPLRTWGAEAGLPCPDVSISISCRKLRILCSLASDSRVPSSGGPEHALSFPNFSRLSAVRELPSSSYGEGTQRQALLGQPRTWESLGEPQAGEAGEKPVQGRLRKAAGPGLEGRASLPRGLWGITGAPWAEAIPTAHPGLPTPGLL